MKPDTLTERKGAMDHIGRALLKSTETREAEKTESQENDTMRTSKRAKPAKLGRPLTIYNLSPAARTRIVREVARRKELGLANWRLQEVVGEAIEAHYGAK